MSKASTEDIWRYRCPNGHTSWVQRLNNDFNGQAKSDYYCQACKRNDDDPHFDQLEDMKA